MLRVFRYVRQFVAQDGRDGEDRKKSGRKGKTTEVIVPVGTTVVQIQLDGRKALMRDLVEAGDMVTIAWGGRGGRGNTYFANPQNRVPLLAECGEAGERVAVELEVRLLADIGIVGLPSVGKSSLLRICSAARPEVAAYPFTTVEAVLGTVEYKDRQFMLVEIPGLIKGSHRGAGLGSDFLRHAGRTRVILHLLDGSSTDVLQDYLQVREEMGLYNTALLEKPEIVAVNKTDLPQVRARLSLIQQTLLENGVWGYPISAATGEGVDTVLSTAFDMVEELRRKEGTRLQETAVVRPKQRVQRPLVEKMGEVFVLKSSQAERVVQRVNLEDDRVLLQLWHYFTRIGVAQALEQAGARPGAMVRIGERELEWK